MDEERRVKTEERRKRMAEAVRKYDAANTTQIHLKLNLGTDADILARLEQVSKQDGGKQGYIKRLIREDIDR